MFVVTDTQSILVRKGDHSDTSVTQTNHKDERRGRGRKEKQKLRGGGLGVKHVPGSESHMSCPNLFYPSHVILS